MMKKYYQFLFESKINKIERKDLHEGDFVLTKGTYDDLNLDYQTGKIIKMKEYGNILVEFDNSFSDLLHSGNKDIGKEKHCWYVNIDNIYTNDEIIAKEYLNRIKEEEKNVVSKLNQNYDTGDVIVITKNLKNINLDLMDELGVVFYKIKDGSLFFEKDKENKNNKIYFIGLLDNIDDRWLKMDNNYLPTNQAGIQLDKLHIRKATQEEIEKGGDKLKNIVDESLSLNKKYEIGDIIIGNGLFSDINFEGQIGIIRNSYINDYRNNLTYYTIQFSNKYFYDYLDETIYSTDRSCYDLPSAFFRNLGDEETKKYKEQIDFLKKEVENFEYDYEKDNYVVTKGTIGSSYDKINLNGKIGKIVAITKLKPNDKFTISFLYKFSDNLYRYDDENPYCYVVNRKNLTIAADDEAKKLIDKINNKQILPLQLSPSLSTLFKRMNFNPVTYFLSQSYFDVTDKNDTISFLPVDKFKRLENHENPYKSRFRQQTTVGKFLRLLNVNMSERDRENYVNSYKAAYDIVILGLSDKLKLVSGEDVRYWYNENQYVKGGGDLNSSCMRYDYKGPEMQMFVDNPDVIQLLILTDEKNKLLGRALVWRLVVPDGETFMDYIYTRHSSDKELFKLYAEQRGWLMADEGNLPSMICLVRPDIKYIKGDNALDHFDTLDYLDSQEGFLSNRYNHQWKRPQ